MATYDFDSIGRPAYFKDDGNTFSSVGNATPSIALAINDIVRLTRVAGGTYLFSLETFNGDLDTGTTLQFSLGYTKVNTAGTQANNATYFGSALTTWQSAVLGSARTRWAFVPIQFNEDMYIIATVTAAATGLAVAVPITTFAQGVARGIK